MPDVDTVRTATDAFAIFGLPRTFPLDTADLERTYAALSRATHPDVLGGEGDPEKELEALDLSSRVNAAYTTLQNPEARANLLLDLLGGPSKEADRTLPEGFLPIIMITREELADAQLEGDAERVAGIELDARNQRTARLQEIATLFAHPAPTTLKQIRLELNALRYYERLLEQVSGQDM